MNETANDDSQAALIPAEEQQAAPPAATAASLPQMLSGLVNLQNAIAAAAQPAAPVPVPQPPVAVAPSMDPNLLAQALPFLASLVGNVNPQPAAAAAYYPPPPVAAPFAPPTGFSAPLPSQVGGSAAVYLDTSALTRLQPGSHFSGREHMDHREAREPREHRELHHHRDERRDAHEERRESPEMLAARRKILCQYFLKGDCKYGARCHFSHNPTEEDIRNAKRKRSGGR